MYEIVKGLKDKFKKCWQALQQNPTYNLPIKIRLALPKLMKPRNAVVAVEQDVKLMLLLNK